MHTTIWLHVYNHFDFFLSFSLYLGWVSIYGPSFRCETKSKKKHCWLDVSMESLVVGTILLTWLALVVSVCRCIHFIEYFFPLSSQNKIIVFRRLPTNSEAGSEASGRTDGARVEDSPGPCSHNTFTFICLAAISISSIVASTQSLRDKCCYLFCHVSTLHPAVSHFLQSLRPLLHFALLETNNHLFVCYVLVQVSSNDYCCCSSPVNKHDATPSLDSINITS